MNDDLLKISLNQGKQFNKYQSKIKKNITKTDSNYKKNKQETFVTLEQEQLVRPSFDGYIPVLKNLRDTRISTNTNNQVDLKELKQLQSRYNDLILQYTDIQKKIGDSSLDTINRLSPNNPYLNKTIRFSTGEICYVTNQGVVKWIPSGEIFDSINVSKDYINLTIPWKSSYNTPGTLIPTNPPLISGTNVQKGQSLGNEGYNVFASKLISNPNSSYVGCYNDKPPVTSVNVVPVLNSSNDVNGFKSSSSSIYLGNNTSFGPWAAFDQNPNTFWHSELSSETNSGTNYNDATGSYEGSRCVNITNIGKVGGEFLQIDIPISNSILNQHTSSENIKVNQYSISPRLDSCCLTTRNPNSWYVLGYNNGEWFQVDRQQNQQFKSGAQKVYNISSPEAYYSSYILLIDKVGNDDQNNNRNSVQVAEWNLFMNSDSNFTNDKRAMNFDPNAIGYTSFNKCQEYALEYGYNYFGFQDLQLDGSSACLVSNDIARIQMYGDASVQTTSIPIWSSNTAGSGATSCYVNMDGNVIINDATGTILWQSPNSPADCLWGGKINQDSLTATYGANCRDNGYNITSGNATDSIKKLLDPKNPTNTLMVTVSNDLFGDPAGGCKKSWDTSYQCGNDWKSAHIDYVEGQNFLYDCKEQSNNCNFFFILQSDGNLCLYRGVDPSVNKGGIWCTMTNGQQKSKNPDWVASKGKFGRSYLKLNETLGLGEWIGSDDGSLMLIMQTDGNLVLYTSETKSGCKVINDKTYGADYDNTSAVYKLNGVGDRATLGKLGYIDGESNLREYPDSMIGFSNDYQIYQKSDSIGNDIGSLIVADQNGCQTSCNNNPDCSAYVYQDFSKTCWLKNRSAFPKGEKQNNNYSVLSVRKPELKGSTTCSNKIVDVDTITFDNYLKDTAMTPETQCNVSVVSQAQQNAFDNIKSELITLGNDIVSKMEKLYNEDNRIFEMLNTNEEQFKKDLENYKLTNLKIKKEYTSFLPNYKNLQSNNIEGMQNFKSYRNMNDLNGMLSDSDLRVLQGNYSYIMWSILAIGILTITINTMKK